MDFDPFAPWRLSLDLVGIGLASQTVIALRTAGMMGLWEAYPSEGSRMVAEKPRAFAQSFTAVAHAALSGADAQQIMRAGLTPIRRRTASNLRRLTKLGPKGAL
jgi:hypothetical protein